MIIVKDRVVKVTTVESHPPTPCSTSFHIDICSQAQAGAGRGGGKGSAPWIFQQAESETPGQALVQAQALFLSTGNGSPKGQRG